MSYRKNDKYNGRIEIPFTFLDSPLGLKITRENCFSTYIRLLRYIVRGQQQDPGGAFDIFNYYHEKRKLLATSWSQSKLADSLGIHRTAVTRHIKKLVAYGFIKIEKKVRYGKEYNVYILGTWEYKKVQGKMTKVESIFAWKIALADALGKGKEIVRQVT